MSVIIDDSFPERFIVDSERCTNISASVTVSALLTSVPAWLGWPGGRGHCSPQTYSTILHLQRLLTLAKSIWSEEHWVGNGESNNNCIRITKPCSAVWTCFYSFYIVCNWIRIIFLPLTKMFLPAKVMFFLMQMQSPLHYVLRLSTLKLQNTFLYRYLQVLAVITG